MYCYDLSCVLSKSSTDCFCSHSVRLSEKRNFTVREIHYAETNAVCFLLSSTAEAEKPPGNPDAESAAPAAAPDSFGDKPKEDDVEQSPPAAAEPTVEEKTDDEGAVSNKTSVESLKEINANNSNNSDSSQQRGRCLAYS